MLADELDLIGYLEASSDEILPLAAKAIDAAPALLPLAGIALKTSSTIYYSGAAASLAAAVAVLYVIPDDSVLSVAIQTALAVPLGAILPGALGVGGFLISKISK